MAGATPVRCCCVRAPTAATASTPTSCAWHLAAHQAVLLNTPHNPTGKVFDGDELGEVADVAIEHDLIVVTDEVYEHLVFPGAEHVPMATLPGMRERTLMISSGGKTFNTTGWKIGWACGPASLVTRPRPPSSSSPTSTGHRSSRRSQPAWSSATTSTRSSPPTSRRSATTCRRAVTRRFRRVRPEATYFITVDIRPVDPPATGWRSAGRSPNDAASWRSPMRCSTPAGARPPPRPVRLLQALDVIDEAVERLAALVRRGWT